MGALLVGVTGLVALVGWYVGVPSLTTVHPGYSSMKPNVALAFVALTIAVVAFGRKRLARSLGAAVWALGVLTVAEYVLGRSLLVDSLLPGIDLHGDSPRMAPATALTLLLLGFAVVAGSSGRATAMRVSALVSFGMSQIALLGYAYGLTELYAVGSATAVAPNSAGCLAVLSLLLLVHPLAGTIGLLRGDGSARKMLRALVPFLLLGPLVLGRLFLFAQDQGLFGPRFGVVALVITMTVLGWAVSWLVALRLYGLDKERDLALGQLAETNFHLDSTVRERTAELADRQSFTNAMLETVDVGILWCDADSKAHTRNRAGRVMFGLGSESLGMQSDEVAPLVDVLDSTGKNLTFEEYPLKRTLMGDDVRGADMLVGPRGGPHREVVVTGNQILGTEGALLGAVVVLSDVTAERTVSRALEDEGRRLTEAQQLGNIGSFECNIVTGRWTYSAQMHNLWGLAPGQLSSARMQALVVEQDQQGARKFWAEACRLGGRHSQELRIRRAHDGSERVLRAVVEVELGADALPLRGRGTHLDITDLTKAEKAAQRAEAFLDAVLAATPDFTFVTRLSTGEIIYVSRGKGILGIGADQLATLGAKATAALVHPEDQPRLLAMDAEATRLQDGEVMQLRYRARHADGQWRWLNRRVTPFRRDVSGQVVEVLGVVRDISDVMEAESRLTHAALHDGLTGLPNRALFVDRLEAALARSARDGREVAVLFCDLDGFKRVNDIAGHAAGDTLLLEIARRLHEVMREHDTVARVGGDEFVMIVEPWNRADTAGQQATSESGLAADRALAIQVAERVALVLQEPVTINGMGHVVSASIGITYATLGAAGPRGAVDAEQVLQDADSAMYLAKRRGKDRFEVFEHGLHTDVAERGRVEQLLRQALSEPLPRWPSRAEPGSVGTQAGSPTFSAAYQPVFDHGTMALMSFEALARLTDGEGIDVPPDVFIPIAEETGMIHLLGRTMMGLACGQLETWRTEVPGLENVSMAVNVSALQAQHPSLLDEVHHELTAHHLDSCDLVLELTETALLQVASSTIVALRSLRAEGVGIAIDDFGIGYASLRYLATLPVSAVKIDRSFTAGLPHDETSTKIVKAVTGLAADMDLACIVEGVETLEQRDALPPGVYVQGFLTGRPQSPENMDVAGMLVITELAPG
jgi:diguanylate cyclase (GGDEF)-like protein/PAS domain S-box-containing protein